MIPNPDIEIRKVAQALDTPGERTKTLITNEVTTHFVRSPCTPMSCTLFRDSILEFGMIFVVHPALNKSRLVSGLRR